MMYLEEEGEPSAAAKSVPSTGVEVTLESIQLLDADSQVSHRINFRKINIETFAGNYLCGSDCAASQRSWQ